MVFSPLIRAPPNATSHPRAACWASKTFSLCTSGRWHRVWEAGGGKRRWESACVGTELSAPLLALVCHPAAGTSYFPIYSNFTVTVQAPSRPCLGCSVSSLLSSPRRCSCFLGHTHASCSTDRSSFFPSHFFLLKARLLYHSNHCHMTPR